MLAVVVGEQIGLPTGNSVDDFILLLTPTLFPPPMWLGGGKRGRGIDSSCPSGKHCPIENVLYYSKAYEKLCWR
jgi:hypothetical protein